MAKSVLDFDAGKELYYSFIDFYFSTLNLQKKNNQRDKNDQDSFRPLFCPVVKKTASLAAYTAH